ncbi:hypothetical protein SLE2022_270690 [Rubroshorea leprosula]
MRRSSDRLRFNLVADISAMSSRSLVPSPFSPLSIAGTQHNYMHLHSVLYLLYRNGRNQWRRDFSDRAERGAIGEPVTGDSHYQSAVDANLGFRQGTFSDQSSFQPQRFSFNPRPPPPHYQNQQFQQPPLHNQYQNQRPPFIQNYAPRPIRPQPQKPPDYRIWEYAKTAPPPNSERFTILSYNILADYVTTSHRPRLYFHIPRHMLDWEWRKRNLIFELGLWSTDIMCFQEVDRFQDLEKELKLRGYNGIWKMRTGNAIDGCAIFWKTSRFKLIYNESIEFNKFELRDNVSQICVFELLSQNNTENTAAPPGSSSDSYKVVICNIHVLYNPKRGEIKLGQVRRLLDRAHAVSKLWNNAPIVLCGDFNCTPKSPLYNFISEQKLDLLGVDRDKVSGQSSADIRPPRPFNPNPGPESTSSRRHPPTIGSKEVATEINDSCSHKQEPNNIDRNVENVPSLNSLSHPSENSKTNTSAENQAVNFDNLVTGDHSTDVRADEEGLQTFDPEVSPPGISASQQSELLANSEKDETMVERRITEDEDTFLTALHGKESDLEISSVQNLHPNSPSDEVFDDFSPFEEKSSYNPSLWTPSEIATATGSEECTCLEHPLQLKSTYTEAEDCSGTRDSNGEPLVTSYNRCFMGTVDYIWRSKGLQTTRVLAPIPKHAMEWTPGFPTKKWGSDHIALASELAFVKDEINCNAESSIVC